MKINFNQTIVAVGVCALTTVAFADDQNRQVPDIITTNTASNWTVTPQGFVQMAATTHMKEIHLGELALQKSSNDDVKSFARKIVSDHQKSFKKLQAVAKKEDLECPTNFMALNTDQMNTEKNVPASSGNYENIPAEKVDKDAPPHLASLLVSTNMEAMSDRMADKAGNNEMNWAALSGVEFDRAFVNKMVAGHEEAINKFETASANLQDAGLKKYAEKTLPALHKHLQMAQELQSKINTWSDSGLTNSAYQSASYNR